MNNNNVISVEFSVKSVESLAHSSWRPGCSIANLNRRTIKRLENIAYMFIEL